MTTRVCNNCKASFRVTDAGKAVRCPKCKTVNAALATVAASAPAAQSAAPSGLARPQLSTVRKRGENMQVTQEIRPDEVRASLTPSVEIQETVITAAAGKIAAEAAPPVLKPKGGAPTTAKTTVPRKPASKEQYLLPAQLGPYEIQHEIGRGGMGMVLEAKDEALKRQVAIKVLHPDTREDPIKRIRFIKEAQITGQLEHPGIVPVHYLGWDEGGNEFFSMKLASGRALDKILEGWHRGEPAIQQEFPLSRLLSIFERVTETVGFAHSHRVIHRDLKPANVMIGTHGEVWVLDWGLAKVVGTPDDRPVREQRPTPNTEAANDVTIDGTVVGTPEYMAPEQAMGDELDEGVDIFALGALLYEILTSKPPYAGRTVNEVVSKAAEGRVVNVRRTARGKNVPPAVAAIAHKCLAAERKERYPGTAELLRDLRAYAAGEPVSALPETGIERVRRFARRHMRVIAASGSLAAVVLIVITVASLLVAKKEREAKNNQEIALQATVDKQKAELEKQTALAATAEKAQRRLRAFQPYAQAADLLNRGQLPERAADLLLKALEIDPEFPEAQFALAEAWRSAGLPAKAAEAYLKADELSVAIGGRNNLHAIVAAGFTYDGAGEYLKAEDAFERAEKQGASDPLALVGRCFREAHHRRLRDARKTAEEALRLGKHLWEAHFAMGYVLIESTKDGILPEKETRPQAIAALRKALEISPRQAEACAWLSNALKMQPATAEDLREAVALQDRSIELEPLNGNRYFARGQHRLARGDTKGADEDFEQGRKLGCGAHLMLYHDASRLARAGKTAEAFKAMGEIVKANREWPPHVYMWICMALETGNQSEVMPVYQRWAAANPTYPYVFVIRAVLRSREGDLAAALKDVKEGLELAPYHAQLRKYRALFLQQDRRFPDALDAAEKMLELDPDDETGLAVKMEALLHLKRYDEALQVIEILEKAHPQRKAKLDQYRAQIERVKPK